MLFVREVVALRIICLAKSWPGTAHFPALLILPEYFKLMLLCYTAAMYVDAKISCAKEKVLMEIFRAFREDLFATRVPSSQLLVSR